MSPCSMGSRFAYGFTCTQGVSFSCLMLTLALFSHLHDTPNWDISLGIRRPSRPCYLSNIAYWETFPNGMEGLS